MIIAFDWTQSTTLVSRIALHCIAFGLFLVPLIAILQPDHLTLTFSLRFPLTRQRSLLHHRGLQCSTESHILREDDLMQWKRISEVE